jgi:hypothetical protein
MIKLIDILNEGIIQLTSDERDQIEALIPKIIDYIEGPQLKNTEYKEVGWINYQFADKTLGKVLIYVGDDNLQATGYFQTNDPKNPTDNVIVIQQNHYKQYFNILNKGYNALVGDKNQGIEDLRKTLKHELIHAKDPALNHHLSKEPYDTKNEEIYYKSWTEFQTMTGQFFESIVSNIDRIMSKNPSNESVRKIETALNEILNFYSGKSKTISQTTADFIQGTDERNIFQRLIRSPINSVLYTLGVNISNSLDKYVWYIGQIKKYNPKGYKEFLKDLYKTIDRSKDKINDTLNSTRKSIPTRADSIPKNITLKEMKKPLNEEFRRMQLLAGLITENEEPQSDPVAEKDAEQGLKQALAVLKAETNSIKPSPQDKEIKEGVALTLGLVASAPGLINALGKSVNWVSKWFQKDKKKGTVVGNALKHWGHELEEAYLGVIGDMLKKAFPERFKLQDVNDKTSALYDLAHGIYASLLIGAAIASGAGAIEAHTKIVAGLEGGLGTFKTAEVIDLAKKISAA